MSISYMSMKDVIVFRSMITRVPPFIGLQKKRTELLCSNMRFLPFLDFLPRGTSESLEVNTAVNGFNS